MGVTYKLADLLEEKIPPMSPGESASNQAAISTAISLKRIADSLEKMEEHLKLLAILKE